ncbi:hypothetical protein D3C87_1607260 [compost metagenome]
MSLLVSASAMPRASATLARRSSDRLSWSRARSRGTRWLARVSSRVSSRAKPGMRLRRVIPSSAERVITSSASRIERRRKSSSRAARLARGASEKAWCTVSAHPASCKGRIRSGSSSRAKMPGRAMRRRAASRKISRVSARPMAGERLRAER